MNPPAGLAKRRPQAGPPTAEYFPPLTLVSRGGLRSDRGTVTAEAAIVLPLIACFVLGMVWLISLGMTQIRVIDASRDAARALARGDDRVVAEELARGSLPSSADVDIEATETRVAVRVAVHAEPPRWLLVPLPAVTVDARSVAQLEAARDHPL